MPLNNPAVAAEVSSGTYVGNGGADRAIPHGLTKTPKAVILAAVDTATPTTSRGAFMISDKAARVISVINLASGALAVSAMNSTNFYVGNATSYANSANEATYTYYWVAVA